MNKQLLGWTIVFSLMATGSDAAEWTRTIDLTQPDSVVDYLDDDFAVTPEAFWIGVEHAFDPRTGEPLSPYAVPERIDFDNGFRATSSRRGKLWDLDDSVPASQTYYAANPDAQQNLWGADSALSHAVRVPPDGTASRRWTGADLGLPGYRVTNVDAFVGSGGALLTLTPAAPGLPLAVRVDARGRVIKQHTFADACEGTSSAVDDRHGGHYERCRASSGWSWTYRRIAAQPAQSWTQAMTFANPGTVVTPEGGLLHVPSLDNDINARYVDPNGVVRFSTTGYLGSAARGHAWFWSEAQARLIHINASGTVLASVPAPEPLLALITHDSGALMIHTETGVLVFYDAAGSEIKRIWSSGAIERDSSRIRFNDGQVLAAEQAHGSETLIDDHGVATSAPILSSAYTVRADASTLCVYDTELEVVNPFDWRHHPRLRCQDRSSGQPAGLHMVWREGVQTLELLDVAAQVRVVVNGQMLHFSKAGALLNSFWLTNAVAVDVHPRQGTALLARNAVGPSPSLMRYAMDGTLRFSQPLAVDHDASVFLAENGDIVLVSGTAPVRIWRFDGNGALLGERDVSAAIAGFEAIDAEVNASGVQLLLRQTPLSTPGKPLHTRLLVLSPSLTDLRADVALHDSWFGHAALWPSADDPRVSITGPSGLIVQQYATTTGSLREKRLLPIGDAEFIRDSLQAHAFASREQQDRYTIDSAGRVRFFDRDKNLQRDVLRIADPNTSGFSGPIRQRALGGSWYSPNSTGQGLIVDLVNNGTQLFSAWHTYAPEGGNTLAKQQWLTVQGDVADQRGAITLPIYRNSGGRFDLAGRTDATPVGSAELVFTSCDRLEFWYRIGDETGAMPLQRLTPRTLPCDDGTRVVAADDTASTIDLSGPWYDPSRSGQGLAVSASGARFNSFLAGWFTYDADAADDADAQHWFTLQGANPSRYGETISASIFRTTGGSRSGEPTRNTHRVGVAQLTVHGCANATLEYVFDDSAVAGPFADRMRAVPLQRLGRCPN